MTCFFKGRPGWGPCDGRLVGAHVLSRDFLKRELRARLTPAELARVLRDKRNIVDACGGPMGNGGHHGIFDSRKLRIARADVPAATEEFAAEHNVTWRLDYDFETGDVRASG